jgi:prefoldin alpha subunit
MSLGGGGGGGGQLQELAQAIEEIEQEQEVVENEIADLQTRKGEIDEAIEGIESLDSGSTVQVPLGGGAFVRAEIADIEEIIVELGADYAAERDSEGAVSTLKSKKEHLDDRIDELQSEIAELETEAEELESRAQQLQQQQMQQMQQQQQPQDE